MYQKLLTCVDSVRKQTPFRPEVAVVLGSGLGDFADGVRAESVVDYASIEGFPVSTVQGHKGRFVFGYVGDVPVVMMQGRVHYYEGYAMSDVVLPIRVMGLLGAKTLILTNAAGGVNESFSPGDLMLITDQISSFVPNPLLGPNPDALGERFPDMTRIYSLRLQQIVRSCAAACGVPIQSGVYVQFSGPSYETPAEVRMCRTIGGDAVGMSTACEAIAARHMGLEVCGISCIANLAVGMTEKPLSHEEVQESAGRAAQKFKTLLNAVIRAV